MSSWGNTFNPVKYHGLINQGATCYLNSVLQVLFMTEDFREAVERDVNENPDHDCIDRHLSSLFADLKEREAYTYKITRKLGITRVYEQKDAAEYFEKILRLTSSGASQIFHGELTHKTICSGCFAEAVRDGAFWHLPLALVDSNSEYSVVDGIENYFKALEFSGEDQIYCENCDNKSDTTIKRVIKHHPDVLMLLLKRFEFNYSYMTYVKNYHTVVVPFTLQIPENQTYELYAVVDHFGDLRSGHYTATIKDDEGWYTFNDRWVKPTDYQPFHNFKGSSSAYLLFYRKSSVSAADAEDSMETSTPEVILPATRQDDYDYDQCQDGKMRMREEAEEAEEEGNVTMVTEMKETVGSTEVGQPPELCNTYSVIKEDQDTKSCNDHESNEETKYYQDPHPNKQRHKEDVGGNAQAGEQAEKRESGHQVIQSSELEESVEVQDRDSGKQRTAEAEVSDRHEVHDRNKDDEVSSTKRSVMETGGKSEDDEQPERKGPSLIKYPDRAVDYQDNEDNAREGLRGTQEAGQDDDVKPVSVQMEGNTGEGERSSEGEKLFELQDNRREGDSEESMPGDDQTRKQDNSRMSNIPEQQRQDKIYVKEHKDGDDKHVEDQNNEGNIRQNQPEQKISVTHAEQKDVGVKRQTEEQGNTREEHVRDKADSSLRGAGSAGSGRMTENQQVGDDEKMRMREEAEEAEEEGNVTMVTEMKDTVGSTEVGQPPELCNTEEDQDTKSYNDHESNEETNYYQDTHPNKQRDEEDVGGNAQADEQAEKRETQLEESVEVQDRDSGKQKISVVSVKRQTEEHGNTREERVRDKADSSLRGAGSAGSGRMTENQQVGDDEKMRMREEAKEAEEEGNVTKVTEMEEKRKKDGDYKHGEPDRKGKPLKKHPNRDVQYKDNEVSARHNMNEDLGGSLKVKQGDDVKPVSVQEQGDEVTKEGTTVESDEQDTKGEKGAQMCTSKKWWQHKKQSQQKPKKTCGCFPWTRQREDETSDSYQVR